MFKYIVVVTKKGHVLVTTAEKNYGKNPTDEKIAETIINFKLALGDEIVHAEFFEK